MDKKNKEGHRIELRLENKLYDKLNNFCKEHNYSKSAFIRNLINFSTSEANDKALIIRDNIYKKKLMYQIHCYGNNLNQIAHKLNIAVKSEDLSASDVIDIKTVLDCIKDIHLKSLELEKYIHDRL